MIESELAAYLKNPALDDQSQAARNTARTNLSAAIGTRVYMARREEQTLTPALTLRRQTTMPQSDLDGECGMRTVLLSLILWVREDAGSPMKVVDIADDLRQAVNHYRGTMGTLYVYGCEIENDYMLAPIKPDDGSDLWLYSYVIDVLMSFQQTAVSVIT